MSALWNNEVLQLLKEVAKAVHSSAEASVSVADSVARLNQSTRRIERSVARIEVNGGASYGWHWVPLVVSITILALLFWMALSLAAMADQWPPPQPPAPGRSASCWFCPTIVLPAQPTPAPSRQEPRCFRAPHAFTQGKAGWPPEVDLETWREVGKADDGDSLSAALASATLIVVVGGHDSSPLRHQQSPDRLDSNFDLATRRANAVMNSLVSSHSTLAAPVVPLALSVAPEICAPEPENHADRRTPRIIVYHTAAEVDRHGP
jgi:hypothetical protein